MKYTDSSSNGQRHSTSMMGMGRSHAHTHFHAHADIEDGLQLRVSSVRFSFASEGATKYVSDEERTKGFFANVIRTALLQDVDVSQ